MSSFSSLYRFIVQVSYRRTRLTELLTTSPSPRPSPSPSPSPSMEIESNDEEIEIIRCEVLNCFVFKMKTICDYLRIGIYF